MKCRYLALLVGLSAAASSLAAAADASAQTVDLWAGGGSMQTLSQPGSERNAGPFVLGAAEFGHAGFPLHLRVESGFASQVIRTRRDGLVAGDVQAVHGAIAYRLSLPVLEAPVSPYLLAGAAAFRHSTRYELRSTDVNIPDANFSLTTSEVVAGTLVGVGATWRLGGVRGFTEARWMPSTTAGGRTSALPVTVGAMLPIWN